MSEENLEIVRRVYDAVARDDAASVLAAYDSEVEWDTSRAALGDLMGRRVYRGHEGLRVFFREYREAWEKIEDACKELIDAGDDRVISVVNVRARGRASGVEVELKQQAGVWTIRDGKIVRVVWFGTRADALQAAGLTH
jgi:ketosteroid isomerase-like protein